MTIKTCLAKTIPALWFSVLALAAFSASGAAQTKRTPAKTPAKRKAKSASKAAPKLVAPARTISAVPSSALAGIVAMYRESPSAARRDAIETYAVTHPRDAMPARLALGIAAYESRDYSDAIASLRKAQAKSGAVADYVSYYLAAARVEAKDL